jgi:hypothetical protein
MQRRPIYDMKLVSEKLMRQAFYCQLRVIVKGRVPPLSQDEQKRRAVMTPGERARVERYSHGTWWINPSTPCEPTSGRFWL